MNPISIGIALIFLSCTGSSQQFIQGSLRKNADPSKLDILFKPNYSSDAGEYCFFLQFAIAIPLGSSEDVGAMAQGVNVFSNMGTLTPIPPYTETFGTPSTEDDERIFGWVFAHPAVVKHNWTKDESFTGAVVTFNKAEALTGAKLLNLSNTGTSGGGANNNTYFAIVTGGPPGSGDRTNLTELFYSIPGVNQSGLYQKTGDQFVQLLPPKN